MGREIKRVALDFDWPIGAGPWKGYVSPYHSQNCKLCDGSGHNPETKRIADAFYAHDGSILDRWVHAITQDEVQALVDAGRLHDFTHEWVRGTGWSPKSPAYIPTAAEVNAWSRRGLGHDAVNRWILVETRAKRLGLWGKCGLCGGEGELWPDAKYKKLAEEWESIEPPAGEGWQVWETVSEGSPVTPVFPTREALIEHLVEGGDAWDRKRGDGGWTRKNAEAFVGAGHAFSLIVADGKVMDASEQGEFLAGGAS